MGWLYYARSPDVLQARLNFYGAVDVAFLRLCDAALASRNGGRVKLARPAAEKGGGGLFGRTLRQGKAWRFLVATGAPFAQFGPEPHDSTDPKSLKMPP